MTGNRIWMMAGWVLLAGAPLHAAKPIGARPAGNPGDWVTSDDYPPDALRAGAAGIVGFRLDLDAAGHVTACTVTASSGNELLDRTTCTVLTAHASFTPARDRSGAAVASHYSSAVHWQIPSGDSPPAASMAGCAPGPLDTIRVIVPTGCQP